ncbi:hypothetical protein [Methylocystis sp.]|uniref:hypothetical protein n=1 Tax=Methylocystis sp. TaxID=1911079 RepID=UPI0025F1896E|nr:hypothetical protein [Methylocystis sp.]
MLRYIATTDALAAGLRRTDISVAGGRDSGLVVGLSRRLSDPAVAGKIESTKSLNVQRKKMVNDLHSPDSLATRERCLDIAYRWLTVCDKASCYLRAEALASLTDEELAHQCIAKWGLDLPQGDDNDLTWFEAYDAEPSNLIDAFAAVRAIFTMSTKGD